MEVKIHPSWKAVLQREFDKPYFATLAAFVKDAYRKGTVYPPPGKIFEAFNRTPFDKVKAVILGQDPYHEPGQAQGLCFYVPPGTTPPPSLRNIATELGKMPDLLSWTDQGVLLLNATLTVAAHCAGSHQGKGWEVFTDAVIDALARERSKSSTLCRSRGMPSNSGRFLSRSLFVYATGIFMAAWSESPRLPGHPPRRTNSTIS